VTPEDAVVLAAKYAALVVVGFRLSWLLIEDRILDRPRDAIKQYAITKGRQKLWVFIQCPWCIGFWAQVALVAVICTWFASLPLPVLWPFAINAAAAPMHYWIDKGTRD
jgi:hypothetical protein